MWQPQRRPKKRTHAWSLWQATASTTHRRLAAADVASRWAWEPTWRIESAGVTLVKGDVGGIVRALNLSRATVRNIRQNLFFAFIYNAVGVPIAAGVLYPFFGVLLCPSLQRLP